jgi:hypothetical protein
MRLGHLTVQDTIRRDENRAEPASDRHAMHAARRIHRSFAPLMACSSVWGQETSCASAHGHCDDDSGHRVTELAANLRLPEFAAERFRSPAEHDHREYARPDE